MKKIAIVGLGKISKPHIDGLLHNNDKYEIVAICDKKEELKDVGRELNVPFYTNHLDAIKQPGVDLVVILTPPVTHYEIAKDALLNKKHVLIEKPGVLEIEHLHELYEVAKANNVTIDVMFHWQFGNEVLAIKDKIHTYGRLRKIEVTAYDPYTETDGKTVKEECVLLGGAWNDSGINILSMLIKFIDVTKLELKQEYIEYDTKNDLPIYINKRYNYEGVEIVLNIDWRENKNHKFTNFFFDEGTLFVHHTAQELWFNSDRVESFYNENRLQTHYINLFKHLKLTLDNEKDTITLHEILLKDTDKK